MPSSKESRISALPAHLQEVLRRRLAGQGQRFDTIAQVDRTEPLPMSFAQQRLWFLNEFQSGGTQAGQEYNSGLALRLQGLLQVPALTAALGQLVARHGRYGPPSTRWTARECRSCIRWATWRCQ